MTSIIQNLSDRFYLVRIFFQSIIWRSLAFIGLIQGILLAGLVFLFLQQKEEKLLQQVDYELKEISTLVIQHIDQLHTPTNELNTILKNLFHPTEQPPATHQLQKDILEQEESTKLVKNSYILVCDKENNQLFSKGTPPEFISKNFGTLSFFSSSKENYRRFQQPALKNYIIETGCSLEKFHQEFNNYRNIALLVAFLFWLLIMCITWFYFSAILKPLKEISAKVSLFAKGHRTQRIHIQESQLEFNQLCTSLNQVFEHLDKENAIQQQFIADASHELRTPLAVFLGQIQRLTTKQQHDSKTTQALKAAERAALRMRNLVEELLVLARLDAMRPAEQVYEEIDLDLLVFTMLQDLTPLAQDRNSELAYAKGNLTIMGNQLDLSKALTNLVANAIKHNPPKTQIKVQTLLQEDQILIRVKDNGYGISPNKQGQIFERFYHTKSSRFRDETSYNSGLGLSICKAIVEAHNGNIQLISTLGKGSMFEIQLPVQQAHFSGIVLKKTSSPHSE